MQKYEMAFLKATKMLKEIDVYLYAGKDFTKFIFSVFLLDFSVVHRYLIWLLFIILFIIFQKLLSNT